MRVAGGPCDAATDSGASCKDKAKEVDAVSDDPEDNKILACTLEAGADFIVSGDHHLTDMKVFHDIPIVNPTAFLTFMDARL